MGALLSTNFLVGAAAVGILYYLFAGGRPVSQRPLYSIEASPATRDFSAIYQSFRVSPKEPLYSTVQRDGKTIATLYEAFESSVKLFSNEQCLGSRQFIKDHQEETIVRGVKKVWSYPELGPYKYQTYGQVAKRVNAFGSGLAGLGLKAGENMALFLETRAEWRIAAQACFSQSFVIMTVYANLGEEALIHGLNEAEAPVMVTSGDLLEILAKHIKSLPKLKKIIYCDTEKAKPADLTTLKDAKVELFTYQALEDLGAAKPVAHHPPSPKDIAVLMYTSGSTGMPKGVMCTHGNGTASLAGAFAGIDIKKGDVHLSYLPLAHILAFIVESGVLSVGGVIAYGNPRTLTDTLVRSCKGDITESMPNFLVGVPTVFDKIKAGVKVKVGAGSAIAQTLFSIAYDARKAALSQGQETPFWKALVFNKLKAALGGRVRFIVSGGAPLSKECGEFLRVCFGVPVLQGYGLTETTAGATLGELDDLTAVSCVGAPLASVQIKLSDCPEMGYLHTDPEPRGEVWIRGPGVCMGYYKNPEKTKEEFVDGWFKTGDIGRVNSNGTLSIIDRKKNLVKPPHGEYIAVERLESTYKNCPLVAGIMVYACSDHNEVVAFIQPSKPGLEGWAKKNNIDLDWAALCSDPRANKAVIDALAQTWKETGLRSMERLSAVALFEEEWTPQNGWLTAAMKLARPSVHSKYAAQIKELYKGF